jgi:hypothetical protein
LKMDDKEKGILGVLGTALSYATQHYSQIVSGIAATATAVYMSFHAIREIKKFIAEKKSKIQ